MMALEATVEHTGEGLDEVQAGDAGGQDWAGPNARREAVGGPLGWRWCECECAVRGALVLHAPASMDG